jgi:uncharacterized protein (DUF488 family)
MRKIYTIGHSNKTIDEFINILKENNIKNVVDIRSYPGSGTYPHFNKENLELSLKKSKISYVHISSLGGRRNLRGIKHKSLKVKSYASYAEHMMTDSFKQGLKELKRIATKNKTVFMCTEVLWWEMSQENDF